MASYTQQELVGSTELAKGLGGFLDRVISRSVEKIAIVRHNKPEAVILPIGDYERMKAIDEMVEHIEIEKIIKEREPGACGAFDYDAYRQERLKRIKGV